MANPIDVLQNRKIKGLFYLVAALGAATTLFVFYERRKAEPEMEKLKEMQEELLRLKIEKLKSEKQRGQF